MAVVFLATAAAMAICSPAVIGNEVKDLKYGVVLFEFYQQKYFETLVEYEYAHERGGIQNHGNYPELLKGGVSLSYGLDDQANGIFSNLIAANTPEEVQNRAWFYLSKMLYLRGDVDRSAATLSNINGAMPRDIDQEYLYLAALVNIKLGYFDEADNISKSFDKDSLYAPFLYFNLGVTFGKQKDYSRAINYLKKTASYVDGSSELDRLGDRSHMAMAYLSDEIQDSDSAYTYLNKVGTTGVFSNRALLGSGWSSVNNGSYQNALAPLRLLEKRSMAIPEVQEAVLLVPHVYEKLDLMGRAAKGFITAYDRYDTMIGQLNSAREVLKDADVLELFVRNLDEILAESDWFGTAPSVSLNSLSPFLFELMSDHSFQSVMKDLRDLYAIRNNLDNWKRKRDDFDVIIDARTAALNTKGREQDIKSLAKEQADLEARYVAMKQSASGLDKDEHALVQWIFNDIQFELDSARMMVEQLNTSPGISFDTDHYASLVSSNMGVLEEELVKTNELIDKVEKVMIELINAELDVHEERLKYYQVQSHLAKVRILDRSLSDLDAPAEDEQHEKVKSPQPPTTSGAEKPDSAGGDDAA